MRCGAARAQEHRGVRQGDDPLGVPQDLTLLVSLSPSGSSFHTSTFSLAFCHFCFSFSVDTPRPPPSPSLPFLSILRVGGGRGSTRLDHRREKAFERRAGIYCPSNSRGGASSRCFLFGADGQGTRERICNFDSLPLFHPLASFSRRLFYGTRVNRGQG